MQIKAESLQKALLRNRFLFSFLFTMVAIFIVSQVVSAQQPEPPTIDGKFQAELIDSVAAALSQTYVFPDVAEKMNKLIRKNLKKGEYKKITDLREFTMRLTEDLRSVSHDLHLGVRIIPPGYGQEQNENFEEEMLRDYRYNNFAFQKLERLPGNIGYLKFNEFVDAKLGGQTAIAAMNFLGHCDALIFDLRDNGGGSPSMIQLLSSYLFEEPTHLNSFYIRESDSTEQFWTQGFVPGPHLFDVPVYVLTSSHTFSGAEEFSYNMKNLKRGTIIGDTTGGGAHPVDIKLFRNLNVGLKLPFGRAINPISGTNWEGVGVIPDIAISSDKALERAQMEALDTLMKTESDEQRKTSLKWAYDGLKAELNPVSLDESKMKEYAGDYGPRHITLVDGSLFYQRNEGTKYALVPMSEDVFLLPELDFFRLKLVRDDSGNVIELVGMYDNGRTDSNPRD
ncbi:MAG: S41 family peptidase [candidate division Zixibacteria bacterium]|nr:S41 family peptidase [candidate division Zixibacteria bacterium]